MSLFLRMTKLADKLKKKNKARHYDASDVKGFSMSCVHMNKYYSYLFSVSKDKDIWLFTAECGLQDYEKYIEFSDKTVSDEDIEKLLEIIKRHDVIAYAQTHKKPKKSRFQILDETVYCFSVSFCDKVFSGGQLATDAAVELKSYFYSLAEKYDVIEE